MKPRTAMSLAALLATMAAGPMAVAQVRPVAPRATTAAGPTAPVPARAASVAQATTAPATAATLPSAAGVPAKADTAPPARSSTAAGVRVLEDDSVRIEETRQRGQIARITVQPKGATGSTLKGYEINVGAGGRDPSQDKSGAGQRVWSVLRF